VHYRSTPPASIRLRAKNALFGEFITNLVNSHFLVIGGYPLAARTLGTSGLPFGLICKDVGAIRFKSHQFFVSYSVKQADTNDSLINKRGIQAVGRAVRILDGQLSAARRTRWSDERKG
jgi:hypothetical protein